MRKDNFIQVIKRFAHELRIPITLQGIENELLVHPDLGSFIAISDIFNNWLVPNAAYQLTFDELLEAEIEDPFIAFVSDNEFLVVSQITRDFAIVSNEKWNNHKLTIQQFREIYSGSILIAEKNDKSGESNYDANRKKEIYENLINLIVYIGAPVALSAFFLFHSVFFYDLTWQTTLLMAIKTVGMVVTILLLVQSLDVNKPVFQKLCGSYYADDCNAILSSKAAKLCNLLSWSEIGVFYFIGTWLVLMFNIQKVAVLQVLGILNFLSLPFAFYLIFYQWRIIKERCILCWVVHALLGLECIVFSPLLSNGLAMPGLTAWVYAVAGMMIPIALWMLIKPYIILASKHDSINAELHDFKYNREVFQASLDKSVKYQLITEEDSIVFGSSQAPNTLTLVIAPFGKLNRTAYLGLDWLSRRDDIKLQIVFATPGNDPNNRVAMHMLALKGRQNNVSLRKAIDDWFNQRRKNFDTWAEDYPIYNDVKAQKAIKTNREWCQLTGINKVPAIFINGKKVSLNYQTSDLKYFM